MRLVHVVGARPNFPKLAPVYRAAKSRSLDQVIVHTGQHYDDEMSASFFRDLGIPSPDLDLEVGSHSQSVQTARIMERLEPVFLNSGADWVVVYGDVNSTLAASLVAAKLGIRIAHVEAGLRSNDWTMPEEINRVVADRLASLLLAPSRDSVERLLQEGEPSHEVEFVGNVMIDSLFFTLERARASGFRRELGIDDRSVVVTLHRPSNVDDPARLSALADALANIARERPVIFPVHPRTRSRIDELRMNFGNVQLLPPIPYIEMLDLVDAAAAVITDSGGLQEETTALGIPCLTVRENTERPITITEGTNTLVPNPLELYAAVCSVPTERSPRRPEGWDGRAGERAVEALMARA